jgi:hypothetical protein
MENLGVKRFLPKPFAVAAIEQFITEVTSAP